MQEITIYRNKENKITGYKSKGHCYFPVHSKSTIETLLQLPIIAFFNKPEWIIENYKEYVIFPFLEDMIESKNIQSVSEAMLIGLISFQKEYPDELTINEKICDGEILDIEIVEIDEIEQLIIKEK